MDDRLVGSRRGSLRHDGVLQFQRVFDESVSQNSAGDIGAVLKRSASVEGDFFSSGLSYDPDILGPGVCAGVGYRFKRRPVFRHRGRGG